MIAHITCKLFIGGGDGGVHAVPVDLLLHSALSLSPTHNVNGLLRLYGDQALFITRSYRALELRRPL